MKEYSNFCASELSRDIQLIFVLHTIAIWMIHKILTKERKIKIAASELISTL